MCHHEFPGLRRFHDVGDIGSGRRSRTSARAAPGRRYSRRRSTVAIFSSILKPDESTSASDRPGRLEPGAGREPLGCHAGAPPTEARHACGATGPPASRCRAAPGVHSWCLITQSAQLAGTNGRRAADAGLRELAPRGRRPRVPDVQVAILIRIGEVGSPRGSRLLSGGRAPRHRCGLQRDHRDGDDAEPRQDVRLLPARAADRRGRRVGRGP